MRPTGMDLPSLAVNSPIPNKSPKYPRRADAGFPVIAELHGADVAQASRNDQLENVGASDPYELAVGASRDREVQ